MTHLRTKTLMAIQLFFAGLMLPMASAQPGSEPVKAVQLTGLVGVKDNAKGTLSVEKAGLHFAYAKGKSDVSAASIEDVTTGADPQAALGKTVTTVSMAAPYGGGLTVPGTLNKLSIFAQRLIPRKLVTRMIARMSKA